MDIPRIRLVPYTVPSTVMDNDPNFKKFIEEIAEVVRIEITCVMIRREKGNGFFGDIFSVKIRGKTRSLNVIVKVLTKNDRMRARVPVDEAYNNEYTFYKDIFPAMENFQRELRMQYFIYAPHFYLGAEYGDQSFLAMEDLTMTEFEMFDLKKQVDEEHLSMICKLFGKFHALSFAFKHLKPEMYQDLVNKLQCVQSGFLRYKGGLFKQCVCVIKEGLKKINSKNKIIDHYAENIEETYKNILVLSKEEKYSCIVHYDSWINNMMFKYRKSGGKKAPLDVKLIDWQTCNVGPPVIDLSLIFYAMASKRILQRMHIYLGVYHEAFEQFLSQTGLKTEDVYPYRVLKEQWKTYCEYGLIQGLIILKMRMNYGERCENFEDNMNADFNAERMQAVLKNLLNHLEEYEVF